MDGGGTYMDVQNGAQNEWVLSLTGNFCCGITLAKSMISSFTPLEKHLSLKPNTGERLRER
jgi:hypothetical protein